MTHKYPEAPRVILSIANIRHYYYMAIALQEAGYLKRVICSIGTTSKVNSKILPQLWQKKLNQRYYPGIDPSRLIVLPWTELIPRGLRDGGFISSGPANWLFSNIYDWATRRYVDECEFFHYVVPAGGYAGTKARDQGSKLIADIRTAHIKDELRILEEEDKMFGFKTQLTDNRLVDKREIEYQLADYLIVPSSYVKDTFRRAGYDEGKIFVAPYGVDTSRFTTLEEQEGEGKQERRKHFRVILVGQIVPRKGAHYLIEAYNRLKFPDGELILVGGMDAKMREWIAQRMDKDSTIKLIGHLPQSELPGWYAHSSVFVLPSLSDAYSLVTLEAMACGLPVIVTENNGSKEAVREGVDGFVVPIRDPEALAEKLTWLYEHPAEREEMGRQASERARQFTWENYGKRIVQIYDQLGVDMSA